MLFSLGQIETILVGQEGNPPLPPPPIPPPPLATRAWMSVKEPSEEFVKKPKDYH